MAERSFFKDDIAEETPLDLRRPASEYTKGSITVPERERLVELIRDVVWLFDKPTLIELGVFHAKTSRMIVEVIKDELRQVKLLCIDIDPKAQKHWLRKIAKFNAPNVFRRFYLGDLKSAVTGLSLEKNSVATIFVDGCHCKKCAFRDIWLAKDLVCDNGLLIIHDTDPKHEFGPKDQTYHGDKRGFGVLQALAKVNLELHGYYLMEEIPGVDGGPRGVRCGMRIYKKARSPLDGVDLDLIDIDHED